ncbi:hypothetical protein A3C37_05610 [Candidatus Peribacteria bacterium RIFCSPHIGHO2_02_FULL_53_20]|nr:MAG: hypothetical protein A3C37_05610 [Candidatus Peribacteria bacterium RIFCSPHIGHO2_02_FULL_53_20]
MCPPTNLCGLAGHVPAKIGPKRKHAVMQAHTPVCGRTAPQFLHSTRELFAFHLLRNGQGPMVRFNVHAQRKTLEHTNSYA